MDDRQTTPLATIQSLSDLFKHLGDPHRLQLLLLLAEEELSVGVLAARIGSSLSAVSHQLRQLRQARLVSRRREGQTIYYRLLDDHVRQLVVLGEEHIRE
ncbi:helix-turn-helix transcriptional regulator [candidate division FCPU426 bacterium]|nr:helix-turn-helix transcriptional regulator [candidate division FCPU426 bacterium]